MTARDYYHHITNRKKLIDCLRCGEKMQPSAMNKHMKTVHLINFKSVCVWCLNSTLSVTFSSSVSAYEHRLQCFHRRYGECRGRLFKKIPFTSWQIVSNQISGYLLNSQVVDTWLKSVQLEFSSWQCNTLSTIQFNFNENYPPWLTDSTDVDNENLKYFHNNFPMDLQLSSFDPFLQRAYSFKKNLWWMHLSLPLDMWQKFLHVYEQNSVNMYVVPHWCICEDASEITLSRLLHVIIVIPQDARDQIINALNSYLGCILFERYAEIMDSNKNPTELMDVITFVSSRKMVRVAGNCANLIHRLYNSNSGYKKILIHRTIIPFATLFAMLYVPNGLRSYIISYHGSDNFWRFPMRKINNRWEIEYQALSPIKHLIFPIVRTMQFCEITTGSECTNFLFIGDRVFTAEVNPSLAEMNNYDWNYHQAIHFNFLLDNTQGLIYRPAAKTQAIINAIHEAVQTLQEEISELNKTNEQLRSILSNYYQQHSPPPQHPHFSNTQEQNK